MSPTSLSLVLINYKITLVMWVSNLKSRTRIFNPVELGRKIVNDKLILFTDILFEGTVKNVHCAYDVNSETSSFNPVIESSNEMVSLRYRPMGRLDFEIKLEDSNPKLGSRTIFSINPNFPGSLIYYRNDIKKIYWSNLIFWPWNIF